MSTLRGEVIAKATSLVQIQTRNSLKEQASRIHEGFGIDLSTAVRMFLKRSIQSVELCMGISFLYPETEAKQLKIIQQNYKHVALMA